MRLLCRNRGHHKLFEAPSYSDLVLPASIRICADGGANRLYDEVPRLLDSKSEDSDVQIRSQYLPQSIRGDLDSVRGDVRDFYAGKGVEITDLAADQDSTDLQKCLHAVEEVLRLKDWELGACSILAVGERFGHVQAACRCSGPDLIIAQLCPFWSSSGPALGARNVPVP